MTLNLDFKVMDIIIPTDALDARSVCDSSVLVKLSVSVSVCRCNVENIVTAESRLRIIESH